MNASSKTQSRIPPLVWILALLELLVTWRRLRQEQRLDALHEATLREFCRANGLRPPDWEPPAAS